MELPLEVSYRNITKTEALEDLVQKQVGKLEKVCDHINSCRVAIEREHDNPNTGSPYRVRIDLTVKRGHELAVDKNSGENRNYEALEPLIKEAFNAARRQLQELTERQRNEVKHR
ncbi:MAG: HPF/RaiA family ribosome-associated protein [Halothece sp.]